MAPQQMFKHTLVISQREGMAVLCGQDHAEAPTPKPLNTEERLSWDARSAPLDQPLLFRKVLSDHLRHGLPREAG